MDMDHMVDHLINGADHMYKYNHLPTKSKPIRYKTIRFFKAQTHANNSKGPLFNDIME